MNDEDKRFATIAAEYALAGHALIRAKPGETQAPYFAIRWGWMKPIHDLDDARQLLNHIQGTK
ncbi:hypothetical protein SRS16CHR_02584 [Variovorax sp. SRS16]|uniref:hypothetical protein n=1 Tax=Variovorax sp. SRS16 TaxID=282217 RepID=UPI001317EF49|nr:hypothetical protein [Variovorax sp. SRS16]VTU20147.1 hypothetical protein SRS16CHR_02584 [Variovorax sp. SRS16]